MIYIFVIIFGATWGSFVNFLIYRLNHQKTLLSIRSECGACQTPLKILDLIPVVSYVFLGGKCRYCSAKLPVYFLWNELVFAVFACLLFYEYGFSISLLLWLIFYSSLWSMAFTDASELTVHNVILYPFLTSSLILSWRQGYIQSQLLQAAIIIVIILIIAWLLSLWKQQSMMGDGDYFVIFALALVYDLDHFITLILISSILGLIAALSMKKYQIPFVTMLFMGVMLLTLTRTIGYLI